MISIGLHGALLGRELVELHSRTQGDDVEYGVKEFSPGPPTLRSHLVRNQSTCWMEKALKAQVTGSTDGDLI